MNVTRTLVTILLISSIIVAFSETVQSQFIRTNTTSYTTTFTTMYTTTFTTVYISTLPGRGWFTITPGILGYDWGVYYISVTTIATKTVESPITTVLQTLIMESVTARDTTAFFIVLALVVGALILVMKARKKMSQQSMPTAPTTKNATSHKHQVADKSKFCRYCGAKIPHDSAFCDSCGKRL